MEACVKLTDGRNLAYAEYGDPHGRPVFFFHGMPGSRLFRPPDEITRKAGVRLITVDRPGYGQSDDQPNRTILDWPDDIVQLADSLNLNYFAVMGHSGGGPYVCACACKLPRRVRAAAILSGAGPVETPSATQGMSALSMFGFTLGRHIPWGLWPLLVWLAFRQKCADPSAAMDRAAGRRPRADAELMARPEVREACLQSEVEAFRFGLRGLARDVFLNTHPWGFRLEEISVPVLLWDGTDDRETPIAMGRYVASRIPGCRATFCEGEAHMLLFPHWEEILTALNTA